MSFHSNIDITIVVLYFNSRIERVETIVYHHSYSSGNWLLQPAVATGCCSPQWQLAAAARSGNLPLKIAVESNSDTNRSSSLMFLKLHY